MERWLAYFAGKLNEQEAEDMGATAIKDAWGATNRFMMTDEEWLAYLNREMAILDYNTDIRASWEEGMEKGREEGLEKGMLFSLQNIMQSMNVSLDKAMDVLQITGEDRKKFANLIKV